jgi:hypothetical protein
MTSIDAAFTGVRPGDTVRLDNRAFLAYCYYARHHVRSSPEYDFPRLGGRPIYAQCHFETLGPVFVTPWRSSTSPGSP